MDSDRVSANRLCELNEYCTYLNIYYIYLKYIYNIIVITLSHHIPKTKTKIYFSRQEGSETT
jgi:hypothetical protein